MRVADLVSELMELGDVGDLQVEVRALGCIGKGCVSVSRVRVGLDWESGCVVIHIDPPVYRHVEAERRGGRRKNA